MYTLKIQNASGELYELTHNPDQYLIEKITGLTTVRNTVNLSTAGTTAGGKFNSSHLESRNIVIYLVLCGDIEANRQLLYRIFPHDSEITVFFKNANRDVKIGARVELVDPDPFSTRERAQISLICPDPYWQDLNTISGNTADSVDHFCFPFAIDEEGMSLSDEYEQPVCSIVNSGDSDIGFLATITIETDKEPVLESSETQSQTPEYLRSHYAILVGDDVFDNLNLTAQTLNVYVNGNLKIPGTDYERELLLKPSGHKWFWMYFPDGGLAAGDSITTETITVAGKSITDMRYFCSNTMKVYSLVEITGIPSWFDLEKDCIVFAYVSGAIGRNVPTNMTTEQQSDGTYILRAEFTAEPDKTMECRIYGSVSKVDVHDATIARTTSVGPWVLKPYVNWLLSPTLPAYTADDIFRVYKGTELLDSSKYAFETDTKMSDNSTVQYFYLHGSLSIDQTLTFSVISSTEGEDIHDYTQAQIDEGFMLVDNLRLHNVNTDEMIAFPDIQFRNGDVIEVSTVPQHLHAVVLESEWMAPGTSLLYTVYENGAFFKLHPGENIIGCTADTNQDFASAEITARQIYGGV